MDKDDDVLGLLLREILSQEAHDIEPSVLMWGIVTISMCVMCLVLVYGAYQIGYMDGLESWR